MSEVFFTFGVLFFISTIITQAFMAYTIFDIASWTRSDIDD